MVDLLLRAGRGRPPRAVLVPLRREARVRELRAARGQQPRVEVGRVG